MERPQIARSQLRGPFLVRGRQLVRPRATRPGQMVGVGVRFAYELLDVSIGQFAVVFFPHTSPVQLCPRQEVPMEYTRCFVGALDYLCGLRHAPSRDSMLLPDGTVIPRGASLRVIYYRSRAGR